ncbi:MAG: phosphonopyruvate decarboxylase, partial [Oscillospiraceae bacterium]|nr:phosphonopyruvate decarboxylase [Oscillospiraceae bacterium]
MKIEALMELIGADFYAGVPDSQLKALCSWLYDRYSVSSHHIIAANEGNAAALAAGYHLATGR